MTIKNFNPQKLLDLAKIQYPEVLQLHQLLSECTECYISDDIPYIHFINPNLKTNYKFNIELSDGDDKTIFISITTENKIGCIMVLEQEGDMLDTYELYNA